MTCSSVRDKKSNRHSRYPCLYCDEMLRVSQMQGRVRSLQILPEYCVQNDCPSAETLITEFVNGTDRFSALGSIPGTCWVLRCPLGFVANRGVGNGTTREP